ncbi:MAG: DUF4245 domain-containing protein [Burkholderiaceae bacterium]|nr:DUF4245 domain-containing protein [Microbacteriaceae bacterium]
MPDRPPRIVAELGRPETPEETAARKAESSRKHRSNQTVSNLILALAACLGIVLIIILVVVRPDLPPPEPVDYTAAAEQAQGGIDAPLARPVLPPGWDANSATITVGSDGITVWSIGFVTPGTQGGIPQFIGLRQGIDANPAWVATQLERGTPTGTQTIDGVEWTTYDKRGEQNTGNLTFAMTTVVGASSYVLYGTAVDEEFQTIASSLVAEFAADPAAAEPAAGSSAG